MNPPIAKKIPKDVTVHDDLAALVGRAAEIQREDLYTLRLREPR